jgi:sulfur-oxidizing protein SoxX
MAASDTLAPLRIVGDGIPEPLSGTKGDAARGRALIVARGAANCVLCHAVPDSEVRFSGDLGPSLAAVGARLDAAQLRLRVADNQRLNPATIMPSYYRADGLLHVAASYRGKPVLTAQQIEDVVAYLSTLRGQNRRSRGRVHDGVCCKAPARSPSRPGCRYMLQQLM